MILISMGANLISSWGPPIRTLNKALEAILQARIEVVVRSPFFTSQALGKTGQNEYCNGVIEVTSHLPPEALLARLHRIERMAGRRRSVRWRSRELDLDILDWHGVVRGSATNRTGYASLVLPHPGIAQRPFVLVPLSVIAPRWHHPCSGLSARQMLRALPASSQGKIIN